MKLSTFAIALGPLALLLAVVTFINPVWLKDFGLAECLFIGAAFGILAVAAARIVEPRD